MKFLPIVFEVAMPGSTLPTARPSRFPCRKKINGRAKLILRARMPVTKLERQG